MRKLRFGQRWSNIYYILHITDTTDSVSTTTGTLLVAGGAGVSGSVHIGGNVFTYGYLAVGGTDLFISRYIPFSKFIISVIALILSI